ncbi:MAG: ATP synthase subunit C family protein [Alphaproteobacteria bacterium]|jgi:F-type H+-transporting ATPase subunit c|uniref:ATP synthase subunit C family protein n=1 Tax=Curvivirga TaxID=2856846 RepID=UPI0012BC16EC|nr:ATP synthase subunit C family protein [Curvivirga aplysinae]MDX1737659.1 ATP synthase subunit C family protein [Alphaproteobacteria bacterium]MTI08260.1 F0F1 ATP synthase subunit C [Curvivirga aplysinae]
MELEAAKMIGAGLAVIGLFGVGIGIGNIFSSLIASIARNPAVQPKVFPLGMLGFALVEAVGLFALVIAFLILFG